MNDTISWPVQNAVAWMPLGKAAGFFFATFVLEDLAAVGAGLLLAANAISWPLAFGACFLGIWTGDAGLYALARFGGRPWFERSRLGRYSSRVVQTEELFRRRGAMILIFSRCVPGARLPTYLAAGFLRHPLPRFLLITGAAACVWTLVVLWLAQTLGASLVHYLSVCRYGALISLFALAVVAIGIQLFRRARGRFELQKITAWLKRWGHWEFWPAWLFYPPVALYCLWLMIKYGGIRVPTAANPGMFSGGLVGESKSATLDDLLAGSPGFTAASGRITGATLGERLRSLEAHRNHLGFDFPLILKPDFGQRGLGVKIIRTVADAERYLNQVDAPVVAQQYVAGPGEVGIFYYRLPDEPHGKIFAITEKIFPSVIGDGRSSLAELIRKDDRAKLIAEKYLNRFAGRAAEILAAGEQLRLVETGNHAQGCIFRDGMRLHTPLLEKRIDEISRRLNGFFIGRYDIRFADESDLRQGLGFKIIELNGAASEATSIYDARNSLWAAYRTLFRQWNLVFAIGAANLRLGAEPTSVSLFWKQWRVFLKASATYPAAD